jgi:hypothetical protein
MDFIERMLGISPDGGSGVFEICLFLIPMGVVALLYLLRKRILQHQRHP